MKKALIISLFTLLVMILGSCSVNMPIIGAPTGVEAEELSMKAVKLKIFVPIENPNRFSFKIKKVDLDLFVNGKNVGKVKKIDKVKIAANSDETYPVSFEITPSEAIANVLYLIGELQSRSPQLEVKGSITVSKFGIPKKIKVEHKQNLDKF
ncbi:MAG: hypothetical protein C0596_01635 [Marinilabiliales bacterium]|nr:MAG: hypothetical protein C0596_01635 [Marinilabiliales bacterium]